MTSKTVTASRHWQNQGPMMRVRLGDLRRLIRENASPTLSDIVAKHKAPHVYIRYDEDQPFEARLSFTGYNPNDHNNHEGVWVYLLEAGVLSENAFAVNSPYITILTVKEPDRMLRSDQYTEDDLRSDMQKLGEMHGADTLIQVFERHTSNIKSMRDEFESMRDELDPELFELGMESLQGDSPFDRLEVLASGLNRVMSKRERLREFYLSLGYVGIEDPMGIIDTTGNTGVIFDPNQVEVIARYKNPESAS